eukprot:14993141-Alexandrium_andersonii.AAC.1
MPPRPKASRTKPHRQRRPELCLGFRTSGPLAAARGQTCRPLAPPRASLAPWMYRNRNKGNKGYFANGGNAASFQCPPPL